MLALLLALAACGKPWVGSGTVVEMRNTPARTYFVPGGYIPASESCSGGYGNVPRTCTRTPAIKMPDTWHTDPERWTLTIVDAEGKRHRVDVGSSTYERCRIDAEWTESRCLG